MKSGSAFASSSSLDVSYHRATAARESYMCDRCLREKETPGTDGPDEFVRDMPCHFSCGHVCCWACTVPDIGSPNSRCPACGEAVDVRFERYLFKVLTERAALRGSSSSETLGSETACSSDGYRRDAGLSCIAKCRGDAEFSSGDDTEYSSDEDDALGEVSDDEDGGAVWKSKQTSPESTGQHLPPFNAFDYLESEDPLIYQEGARYSPRPVSCERRSKPALRETERYLVTQNVADTALLLDKDRRSISALSPSPTRIVSVFQQKGDIDVQEGTADDEKPRRRRVRRHALRAQSETSSSESAGVTHDAAPLYYQCAHEYELNRGSGNTQTRPPLRKYHSDRPSSSFAWAESSPKSSTHHHRHRHSVPPELLEDHDSKHHRHKDEKHGNHHRKTRSLGGISASSWIFADSSKGKRRGSGAQIRR
ncbi:hypothetical protein PG994_011911 [Apiospora phragmitis]|uniref:RING-type domain-containing protein n=1 Tax=Apiospora phragmitis TaxID=2905665 RepID=A0ABR1TWD2_9PEZI